MTFLLGENDVSNSPDDNTSSVTKNTNRKKGQKLTKFFLELAQRSILGKLAQRYF